MNPKKILLHNINQEVIGPYDLFICSSSFEDRCKSIASHIDVSRINRAFIVSNMNLLEYIGKNKNDLEKLFAEKGHSVEVSTLDPLMTADNLQSALTDAIKIGSTDRILLDVTTFTHESLLILLRLLRMHCPTSIITVGYTNAAEYSIGNDVKHKWLSRGIEGIRSVLGYPGKVIPSRKTHLIIIVGYEHERAAGLIEALEPHSIALGYGRSGTATTDKNKDANERYMGLVNQMAASYSKVCTFEIPCNNPYGTSKEISHQISFAEGMNVLIAPMNNKLSTIGVAHAVFNNEDVQLCYAQALRYNYFNYSRSGNQCYVFEIDPKGGGRGQADK